MSGSLSQRRRGRAPSPKRPGLGGASQGLLRKRGLTGLDWSPTGQLQKSYCSPACPLPLFQEDPPRSPFKGAPRALRASPRGGQTGKGNSAARPGPGGWGAAVTAGSRGAEKLEPSPSSHLEARRFWSVAFRCPGEPVLSLPPPYICESEGFAPRLQSDLRSLLLRSGSPFRSADPVGWPGLVGGLKEL